MKSAKQDVPSLYWILRTKKKWSQYQIRPLDKKYKNTSVFGTKIAGMWSVCNLRKKELFKTSFFNFSLEYISMGKK
jgi:hypothetical protein